MKKEIVSLLKIAKRLVSEVPVWLDSMNSGVDGTNADTIVKILKIGDNVKIDGHEGEVTGITKKIYKKKRSKYPDISPMSSDLRKFEEETTEQLILTVKTINEWAHRSSFTFYGQIKVK